MSTTGGCHCGAIRYSVESDAEHHALCHCTDCRRWAGAPMVGWIAFKDADVTVTGEPKTYQSSDQATRQFCGTCGTGLFYRNESILPGIVDIQSGTLDAPAENAPQAEIMVKDRLSWLDDVAGLPKFETYPAI